MGVLFFLQEWIGCIILGGIGLICWIITYILAPIESRIKKKNVSGIPLIGSIFIVVAFLLTPHHKQFAWIGLLEWVVLLPSFIAVFLDHWKDKRKDRKNEVIHMSDKSFKLKIDASQCTSLISNGAFLEKKNVYDIWKFRDIELESGKIYALVSEYGQGCMYVSYLLGGRVEFGDLRLYIDEKEISKDFLNDISWNLEPLKEKCKNCKVKKLIEKALLSNHSDEDFDQIQNDFMLTEPRLDRKLCCLSGERWRASAALGYANKKRIFFAPYKTSSFYYQMSRTGLGKVLRKIADSGAIVVLPVGSDDVLKHIADECIYLNPQFENFDEAKRKHE